MDLEQGIESLGERMVKAARLAVAMHLYQAAASDKKQERSFDEPWLDGQSFRQRVVIGGAGPCIVNAFSSASDHDANPVTDDKLP